MKYDKKIKTLITSIQQDTQAYSDYVNTFGNTCAYTDRMVESIIKNSKELEKTYNKQVKILENF